MTSRVGRLNADDASGRRLPGVGGRRRGRLHLDVLLLVGLEVSRLHGARAKLLHCEQKVVLLPLVGGPEVARPVRMLAHHLQHVGEGGQRLDARAPLADSAVPRRGPFRTLPGGPCSTGPRPSPAKAARRPRKSAPAVGRGRGPPARPAPPVAQAAVRRPEPPPAEAVRSGPRPRCWRRRGEWQWGAETPCNSTLADFSPAWVGEMGGTAPAGSSRDGDRLQNRRGWRF